MGKWEDEAEIYRFMRQAKIRDLYMAYADQFPEYFLTLASKHNMPTFEFVRLVSEFHHQLDRKLLRRPPHLKPLDQRTNGIMFLEQIKTHIHGHAMVRFAGRETTTTLREHCAAIWTKLCPGGTIDLQEQKDEHLSGYLTKEMEAWGYDDLRQAILFRDLIGG
ncbi:hypothetical protein VW35_17015 [Devosia soli]|uniref:Uncharacterized protein n=2 Tax=Devosia soli TaxID=361041 RepID=A0A0F5L4D7_9HYPH|nr:hypothetical protein VW35_17015 [Devosia soli]